MMFFVHSVPLLFCVFMLFKKKKGEKLGFVTKKKISVSCPCAICGTLCLTLQRKSLA